MSLSPRCTLIISVYRDTENLRCILSALKKQSSKPDEVIVSEDGQDEAIAKVCDEFRDDWDNFLHLTQEDIGFRKNRALNRAILGSSYPLLLFIDGDCVPHRRFVEMHKKNAEFGRVSAGRRVELGRFFSRLVKAQSWFGRAIQNPVVYFLLILPLHIDKIKNFESGIYSPLLHRFNKGKYLGLLGCNFSIYKNDFEKINGFDVRYEMPGIGEDSDIEWRLSKIGIKVKNVKFLAIEYHLYHPVRYLPSIENKRIFQDTREQNSIVCKHGLDASGP